ncbi:uncharacterized protein VTP21DRAFT_6806 [Calcarisporiella thermophila]|uniref:uncharacterized protein n=1 Tax=Calcarisporiella thermophila TaxID=911321 RepID=UPI0037436AB6
MTTTTNARVIPLTCSGHTRPVVDLQFSPVLSDGSFYLISACKDGNPMLRDGKTGDWIGTFQGHKGAVWSARLSKDASKAVTASADFSVKVWDAKTGSELHSFVHNHIARAAEFSFDGMRIVTGGLEKRLRIYDLMRPDAPMEIEAAHGAAIKSVAWEDQRGVVLSAGDEKEIKVWDIRTLKQVTSLQAEGPITSMNLSADGTHITSTSGKRADFWDASNFQLFKSYDLQHDVSSISLHPDRSRFVAGSGTDLWVRIYSFEDGREMEVYKGHHGPIHAVSYSPDGELYATGSEDGTIRLWQTTPGKSYGLWQTKNAIGNAAREQEHEIGDSGVIREI